MSNAIRRLLKLVKHELDSFKKNRDRKAGIFLIATAYLFVSPIVQASKILNIIDLDAAKFPSQTLETFLELSNEDQNDLPVEKRCCDYFPYGFLAFDCNGKKHVLIERNCAKTNSIL